MINPHALSPADLAMADETARLLARLDVQHKNSAERDGRTPSDVYGCAARILRAVAAGRSGNTAEEPMIAEDDGTEQPVIYGGEPIAHDTPVLIIPLTEGEEGGELT